MPSVNSNLSRSPETPNLGKQGKSKGFDSCDRPSNLKLGFKSLIFQPVWPWNLMDDLKKTIGQFFYTMSSIVHHFKSIDAVNLSYSPEMLNSGQIGDFCLAWPWNLKDDLEKQ